MATYVISDIHGEYDLFLELLDRIGLKASDTLYVLGDVLDRGPHPIRTLLKLMNMPNAICIVGNHELMALECLKFLCTEITDDSITRLQPETLTNLLSWQGNGGKTTMDEFHRLDPETRQDVIEFIRDFEIYAEVSAGGRNYLLVHGGLGNYAPDKEIDAYSIKELVWDRADYDTVYFPDTYVITGHTPTQLISQNSRPGFIYRANQHIAIDCGACWNGGRLAAICLETGEEFYSSVNTRHPEEE